MKKKASRSNIKCRSCGTLMINVPTGTKFCSELCRYNSGGKIIQTNGCIEWKSKRSYHLHDVACEIKNGPQPSKKHYVLHGCDNPLCVNPDHLRWGTQKENIQDMFKRGRENNPLRVNEDAANAKHTNIEFEALDKEIQQWINNNKPFGGLMKICGKLNMPKDVVKNRRRDYFPNYRYIGPFTV